MGRTPHPRIDDLLALHAERKTEIVSRLHEFASVPRSEYFYELAYCLLTPQSSAINAGKVIALLKEQNFFDAPFNPVGMLRDKKHYVRFHATKSQRILEMRSDFTAISDRLAAGGSGEELREWLVANVKGLGWKEASHFLRNIGHRNLAILDRHILRNLHRIGVLRRIPHTLTPREYKRIEKRFRKFCEEIDIPMDEVDLTFWSMETGFILK